MTAFPSVSIIIPAYNYASLLPHAVSSAAQQGIPDLDILIVNDGSTDNTQAVGETLVSQFENVRMIHQKNEGASSARNTGIRNTKSEYLIFLDADDTLEPNALSNILCTIKDFEHPFFIVCDHYNADKMEKKTYRPATKKNIDQHSKSDLLKMYFKKQLSLANGAVIMHRSIFSDIAFNPSIVSSEDIPVWAYAIATTKTIHVPIALNCVLSHPGSYRTEAWRVKKAQYAPVDEFFSYPNMEQRFQHLKGYIYGRRALSIFRILYRANEAKLARHYFNDALRYAPKLIFEFNYLKKYIVAFFKRN